MATNGGGGVQREAEAAVGGRNLVYVWGYLPGASVEKSPIAAPVEIRLGGGDSWKDVCGGGCGFAMAISESGKLITWGSADDEGQSYVASGKHGEIPEPFPLPTEASIVRAAAGWAHCVSVTEAGEIYTWGWKECVPSSKAVSDMAFGGGSQKDTSGRQSSTATEQVSPKSQSSNSAQASDKKAGEEISKRRKTSSTKQELESMAPGDETFTLPPCLVNLGPGVRISTVAAGGRHTLALSDMGQVWGWGYGGEGQLGLGSRIKMVSSPHLIPCIQPPSLRKDGTLIGNNGSISSAMQMSKAPGSCVKQIACGGRHSAVLTDSGALHTFGWGLYGQCGHGNTNDQLRPTCVSSLVGNAIGGIAAGLWHTLCVTVDGHVYTFGGNQFGQLGTGTEHAETVPRLLDCPGLKEKHVKMVSSGARHNAVLTDDGQVFSWGWNKYGQLGLGDTIDRNIPSRVSFEGFVPKNIACGWWHTLLLAEEP
ncbi:ultraviolet-B receptor UVR8-like [Punica granatum]|uniref:Ultraviolet-B receptor UVR8-like n=1 Tax=Punica granatum TaxID=22663 RepID=A0A6P8DP32_PUNGR|nr:ultraviolet-B receptor UVR8-like [Punica granatum]